MRSGFEEIQHTADWALKVWAPGFAGLLEQAALGMNQLMAVKIDLQQPVEREFTLSADDGESLLVAFLNRILYEMEMDSIGFDQFDLQGNQQKLHARLKGGRVVELQKMIKAVTYHNLKIRTIDGGLETTL